MAPATPPAMAYPLPAAVAAWVSSGSSSQVDGVMFLAEFFEGDYEVYVTSHGMAHSFQFFGGAWSDEDYFGVRVFFFYNAGGCYHWGQLLGDVVDHSWEVFLCHDGP